MATTIEWYGGDGANPIVPAESGSNDTLGFFGAGFGFSIRVGEFNNSTFVTNDNGTVNHGQVPNLRYANPSGAYVASELVPTELLEVDDDEATLKIILTTDSIVQTQNTTFRAFDRNDVDNEPSGVSVYAAEILKDDPMIRGSGDANWIQIGGSGSVLSLENHSYASGVHEWYIGLTVTPTSIGEKTNLGFIFQTEFV